jgi:hypothetical protein
MSSHFPILDEVAIDTDGTTALSGAANVTLLLTE